MSEVLVVEDNPVNLKLAKTVLKVNGFDVVGAESAEEALKLLETLRPRLILTDIQMPGMDGIQFARACRERETLRGIRIVALTAYAMRGDRERFLAEGFDGYISKPIDPGTFPALVRALMK